MECMKTKKKKKSVISKNRVKGFILRVAVCLFATVLMLSSSIVSASAAESGTQTGAAEVSTVMIQPVEADKVLTDKTVISGMNVQLENPVSSANTETAVVTTIPLTAVPEAPTPAPAVKTAPAYVYNLSEYDKKLLLQVGMAEAGNQGADGIGLVMQTVMNRLYQDPGNKFPNSVHGIIYAPNQYTTNKVYKPNKDCYAALEYLMQGRYVAWSKGAIAFAALKGGKWHDKNLKHLFTYKGHKFYKLIHKL